MNKIIEYSKSVKDILELKKYMEVENKKLFDDVKKINAIYIKQKKRKFCKNCNSRLKKIVFFSFKIPYFFCSNCSHINGGYEDTDFFIKKLYEINKTEYGGSYFLDYKKKMNMIYKPKVNFLKKVIKSKFDILDFGCGTGIFLKACEAYKIYGYGIESNSRMVKFGNKILNKSKIYHRSIDQSFNEIKMSNSKCISLISVLEHLQKPNIVFENFKKSKSGYLYICVPLFSFSSFVENAFDNVSPRNLFGPHTHLYTRESLKYILSKFKLKILGEWWFGVDFNDLSRSLKLSFKINNKEIFNKLFYKYYQSSIDDFQNILDKKKICSEVHLVISK